MKLNEQSEKIRLALIYGGRSGEHDISIRSAKSVKEALDRSKYETIEFFIDQYGKWHPCPISAEPAANEGIDVVFPILHGTFGEDGTVQGLLEMAELPYVGAGVLASALSMDKVMTKRVCHEAGLPMVEYVVLSREHLGTELELPFGFPAFVKPANLGSSVGISKARNRTELDAAIRLAAQYDRKVLVERGVKGREFECAVLDGEPVTASVPCEIIPSQEFYTYEDKYVLNTAQIELPARITERQTSEMRRLAIRAFEAVGCEGMARVDFLMDGATGELYVNEINTIPGFTSISMYPKMWEHSGVPYPELLDRLIQLALVRARARKQTRYAK